MRKAKPMRKDAWLIVTAGMMAWLGVVPGRASGN